MSCVVIVVLALYLFIPIEYTGVSDIKCIEFNGIFDVIQYKFKMNEKKRAKP
jgi:hypothetical protein